MVERILARRTKVDLYFGGTNITNEIAPYLLSLNYTDDQDDLADDLKIGLQDRDGLWVEHWLTEAVDAAAGGKLSIWGAITPQGDGRTGTLPTGPLELDSVDYTDPPAKVAINATSLAFSSNIRQTKKSKVWKGCTLSQIAARIAENGGMGFLYESVNDPYYERVEQTKQSDVNFLKKLCEDAGISFKATNGKLVLYDQAAYEAKPPVFTIENRGGSYLNCKLHSGSADTKYAKCRVRYMDPSTGKCVEAVVEDNTVSGEQVLEVAAKVSSIGEAQELGRKRLRLHNKLAKTAVFTLPGNIALVAGVTVLLRGWGGWDGKYIVTRATHTVDSSGYITQIRLRKVLNY